jgi:ABC-type transporter Mla MlaB component
MAPIAELVAIDPKDVTRSLLQAAEKLSSTPADATFDFSPVKQLDASAVRALEEVARVADEKSFRVALRGVNVDVYKVMKLVKLSQRFSFEN